MLTYRRYCHDDYDMVSRWFDGINWPIIPKESIPPFGIIVYDESGDLAAHFIYVAQEPEYDFINPGWIVMDPDIPYKMLIKVMDCIANAHIEIAKKYGKTHILMTLKTESIINHLCDKHGYLKAEVGVTRLIKHVDPARTKEGIFWYDQECIDHYYPDSPYANKK